jgi:pseudouridylate synthase
MSAHLAFSDEVAAARAAGRPLVALESTIIAHGMPYPDNLETARSLEAIIREAGATPATIAVLDGKVRVGLSEGQLERLAAPQDGEPGVLKLSRRDLPYAVGTGRAGATTVAATMIAADLAGIRVFATGGIGGVHRGAQATMDVSADLEELGRTSVAVVCAGAKSILDLGLTLEVLETKGVPVVGYRTDAFPAFYTRRSGFGVDCRLESPEAVARFLAVKWGLGLAGGVVVANPVPAEDALPEDAIGAAIDAALAEAESQGVAGKAVTPFLLARVSELTGGSSLRANIALVRDNARLAARVAVAYAAVSGEARAT